MNVPDDIDLYALAAKRQELFIRHLNAGRYDLAEKDLAKGATWLHVNHEPVRTLGTVGKHGWGHFQWMNTHGAPWSDVELPSLFQILDLALQGGHRDVVECLLDQRTPSDRAGWFERHETLWSATMSAQATDLIWVTQKRVEAGYPPCSLDPYTLLISSAKATRRDDLHLKKVKVWLSNNQPYEPAADRDQLYPVSHPLAALLREAWKYENPCNVGEMWDVLVIGLALDVSAKPKNPAQHWCQDSLLAQATKTTWWEAWKIKTRADARCEALATKAALPTRRTRPRS